jgi:hypothetical protein
MATDSLPIQPENLPLLDEPNFIQRALFPAFLIFSVCFYAYRFLLGMGSPLTTVYDSDAPNWVRISKDIIWLAVLGIGLTFSSPESWEFARRNRQEHRTFFRGLFALICFFVLLGTLHLFYYQSALDTFLYWIRYPLEYMPLAFFVPLFVTQWQPRVRLLLGLGWLSVAFLFFEMFSGLQVGFYSRFGSILGSPNDYGIFCALFILSLLVCARKWSHWLLLIFMFCGLFLTISRSALIGLLAGVCILLYLRRVKIAALISLLLLSTVAGVLLWMFPNLLLSPEVQFGLSHLGTSGTMDNSAIARLNELQVFQTRFGDFDLATLLFGTDYFHIESWYLALLVRTGVFGLLLWVGVMVATAVHGWRKRHLSPVYAVATSGLVCICVASAFIPYPDTFPTNLCLWLAVGTIWAPLMRGHTAPQHSPAGISVSPHAAHT